MSIKILLITLLCLLIVGCEPENQKQNKRMELEQRFRVAYPETWQQKLLEYDLQQEKIKRQEKQRAIERL
jgi:hypothetical protein